MVLTLELFEESTWTLALCSISWRVHNSSVVILPGVGHDECPQLSGTFVCLFLQHREPWSSLRKHHPSSNLTVPSVKVPQRYASRHSFAAGFRKGRSANLRGKPRIYFDTFYCFSRWCSSSFRQPCHSYPHPR